MIPSFGRDAASSSISLRSRITSWMPWRMASLLPVSRYGFGSGGCSGVLPLPKSMPLPAPTSVLVPLLAGRRSLPLSRTLSFCLSMPLPCARTGIVDVQEINNATISLRMISHLVHGATKATRGFQGENRLTGKQFQAELYSGFSEHLRPRFSLHSEDLDPVPTCVVLALLPRNLLSCCRSCARRHLAKAHARSRDNRTGPDLQQPATNFHRVRRLAQEAILCAVLCCTESGARRRSCTPCHRCAICLLVLMRR